jgi:hypothetical protein
MKWYYSQINDNNCPFYSVLFSDLVCCFGRRYMQMHCRFLTCVSNGWLSTCETKCCHPHRCWEVSRSKKNRKNGWNLRTQWHGHPADGKEIQAKTGKGTKTKLYSFPSSFNMFVLPTRVSLYTWPLEWMFCSWDAHASFRLVFCVPLV